MFYFLFSSNPYINKKFPNWNFFYRLLSKLSKNIFFHNQYLNLWLWWPKMPFLIFIFLLYVEQILHPHKICHNNSNHNSENHARCLDSPTLWKTPFNNQILKMYSKILKKNLYFLSYLVNFFCIIPIELSKTQNKT